MSTRREAVPFGLGLLASLLAHGGFLLLIPGTLPRKPPATLDMVVVDLQPAPQPPSEEPKPEPAAVPKPPPSTKSPRAAVGSESGQGERAEAPGGAPPEGAEQPGEASSAQGQPSPAPTLQTARVPRPETVSIPPPSAPRRPSARDLTPTWRDLAASRAPAREPGPAGAQRYEATVDLSNPLEPLGPFESQVKQRVEAKWNQYADDAMDRAKRSGTAVIWFTLAPDGSLVNLTFEKRSGSSILDEEAEAAVRRAGPFPSFPHGWTIQRLHLVAHFDYLLR